MNLPGLDFQLGEDVDALRAAGVQVGLNPTEAGDLMAEIIKGL